MKTENKGKQIELVKEALIEKITGKNYDEENYIKPKFKSLTQEEIDNIHKKGMLTPEEVVEEWESIGICEPGNSGFNERCHDFANCHDCLVDYSNQKDEYTSLIQMIKETKIFNEIGADLKEYIRGGENQKVKTR